eukprot:snap_masked-scaffold_9-processed-gene-1.22-mRNA-1 protein AED:1.00 eAED:1.00 QI:0/0/0/0/1/1/2/0/62
MLINKKNSFSISNLIAINGTQQLDSCFQCHLLMKTQAPLNNPLGLRILGEIKNSFNVVQIGI